jgi:hypothetical protein
MSNSFIHSAGRVSPPNEHGVDAWLLLSVPTAVLLTIAAGSGVFVRGLYRDAPFFTVQAVAQDVITLFVVLPTFVVSAWLAGRGSTRGRVVWLGVLVYLVYSYIIDAFVVRFNPMFLVYAALLGCALYALIGGVITTDMDGIKARLAERAPVKSVSAFLALAAVTFYIVWLSEAVPAVLAGTVPLSVQQNGTSTNAVQVLDMAWMLPAFLISAVGLVRKTPLGYVLAGVSLTFIALLTLAVLSIVVLMVRGGYPVVVPQVILFGAFFGFSVGLLAWYLNALRPSAGPNTAVAAADHRGPGRGPEARVGTQAGPPTEARG